MIIPNFPAKFERKIIILVPLKDNSLKSKIQHVEKKLKTFVYFRLNKRRKLITFLNFFGTLDRLLQIMKKQIT